MGPGRATASTTRPARTVTGLLRTEAIRRRGPRRGLEAVRPATPERVDRVDPRPLPGPVGHVPPAEAEARLHAQMHATNAAARPKRNHPPPNPERSSPWGGGCRSSGWGFGSGGPGGGRCHRLAARPFLGGGAMGARAAHVLGDEVGMRAQAVAGACDLDDDGVVQEAVEERGGDDGIGLRRRPTRRSRGWRSAVSHGAAIGRGPWRTRPSRGRRPRAGRTGSPLRG